MSASAVKAAFVTSRNNKGEIVYGQITDKNGVHPDITGSDIFFIMKEPGSDTVKVKGVATVDVGVDGKWFYEFADADLDEKGMFTTKIEVHFPDGREITFPESVPPPYMEVLDDLG